MAVVELNFVFVDDFVGFDTRCSTAKLSFAALFKFY